MSEGTRARGRLTPTPFAIPRDGGSIPPHLHNVAPLVFRAPTGPAAREARASLRSAPRLEARPCPPDPPAPSTRVARGVLIGVCVGSLSGQALPLSNSARNSPASASNIEFMSLELQRFWAISKSDRGKLCAKCVCVGWSRCRVSKPSQAPPPPGGPVGAHRHRGLARRHINFACNSPAAYSNIEFASLELQRFLGLLNFGPIELHAKFVWRWPCEHVLALRTGRLHRGQVLRFLRRASHLWHRGDVVLASISASRSVQGSPCSASWW